MSNLSELKCVALRKGDSALMETEIADFLLQVSEWDLSEEDGVPRLERTFKFKDYSQSLAFTNKIAAIAEDEDHHPLIVLEWGRVKVAWWSHIIKGLHKNDFIMAAKTDEIYG